MKGVNNKVEMNNIASDNEIIELLRNERECERGFRLLLKTYGNKLYWHIRRIVVSKEDAEDAMQETSIKIFSKFDSFKGDSSLFTWLYTIATNEALQVLRCRCNLFQSVDSDGVGERLRETMYAENDVDVKTAEVVFQEALLTLPTQQRLAFNMRYYDELSYEEIAEVTGKNVSTLKSNYHFAVEKIKKYIKENAL
ncbi:MAG: RNA polymerase sigma factor [Bacteroidales bacterium]|nr:RNA polymerase sigma factor [Bacteroidales bacterium]